jgi:hypothetical protein
VNDAGCLSHHLLAVSPKSGIKAAQSGKCGGAGHIGDRETRRGNFLPPTVWDKISAISSIVSAAVACLALIAAVFGGVFVYWQIQQANDQLTLARENLYSTNQYKAQTDLFTQVFSMLAAVQNEARNPTPSAHEATGRQVRILDAYMKAVDALHNNHGLSDPTWVTIVTTYCPQINDYEYKVGNESLGATKEICEDKKNKLLWKGENH